MTKDLLIALGRLTLKFAALDEHVSWAYVILHPGGREAARAGMPGPFKNRIVCIRGMVESRARKASLETNRGVLDFSALLDTLEAIASDRNLYVHGLITELPEVDLRFVSHEKRDRKTGRMEVRDEEITPDSIPALNVRIDSASAELVNLALMLRKMIRDAERQQS
jgi:hypothetical protein